MLPDTPTVPRADTGGLNDALKRNIDVLERRKAARAASASMQDRLAQRITAFTGSMRFVYFHLALYSAWVVLNIGLLPGVRAFDPSFVILASEASVEAIFLSTFVLISQNRMAAAADERADLDLHINLLTEHELTKLAVVITAIAHKVGVADTMPAGVDEIVRDVAPEAVMDEIEGKQDAVAG